MDPIDKSLARLDKIETDLLNGEPVDWELELQLQAVHVAQAGVHYTKQAIERVNNSDQNSQNIQEKEDDKLNGN